MHPIKRQKLDAVNSTLIKPFRSPLRIDRNIAARQAGTTNRKESKQHCIDTSETAKLLQISPLSTPQQEIRSPSSPGAALKLQVAASEDVDALQKEYASLARKLTSLRQSLDTAQQALKFETNDQASDINALIVKWRSIVRETAEELFEDAKHRVEKEGGLHSWLKQQEREPPDLWFEERQVKLTDAQRKMLEVQREDERAEAEKYGLVEKEDVVAEEDITFTMDKMLQQMNIDLNLVGYNKVDHSWVD